MASDRKKFKIPTAEEMEVTEASSSTSFKPQDTLAAYKKQEIADKSRIKSKCDDKDTSQPKMASFLAKPVPPLPEVKSKTKHHLDSGTANTSSVATGVTKPDITKSANSAVPNPVSVTSTGNTDTSSTSNSASLKEQQAHIVLPKGAHSNSLLVNSRQRGNPILKFVRNIPWEFGDIVPDYVMGLGTCALYLSLRYHQLNPNYIHDRLKQLGRAYNLRVLLVQVDIKEPHHLIKDLAKMCILADCTLILAFSPEEAGRYLETFKIYEYKPPDAIMEKNEQDFMSKLTECLTTIKSVNKTDAMTLMSTFKTMEGIMKASKEDLSLCPGFGPQKAQRAHDVFQEPFLKANKLKKKD